MEIFKECLNYGNHGYTGIEDLNPIKQHQLSAWLLLRDI